MCGIAGIYHFDRNHPVESEVLSSMVHVLKHRGPDGDGQYIHRNLGLGHTRLSIIDVSDIALQPMCNAPKKIWITYNGEVYNFPELRQFLINKGYRFKSHSDTEVILYLYEELGEACLDRLDGMFAFAIYDQEKEELFLARDRIGIKPLYYYLDDKILIFASEIKSILKHPSVTRKINFKAFHQYLQFMNVPVPETIFEGIQKLEPGHFISIENGNFRKKEYWDIQSLGNSPLSEQELQQKLEQQFFKSVKSHMIADVPVGAFLSGGVDSSAIVAAASQHHTEPLNTFSITFKGSQTYDESAYAKKVSQHCKTRHHEFEMTPSLIETLPKMIWHCDEPFSVSSSFALFLLSQYTSKHVKVVLSGDGSDEIFAGYPRHFAKRKLEGITGKIPEGLKKGINSTVLSVQDKFRFNTNSFPMYKVRNVWEQLFLSDSEFYAYQLSCFKPTDFQSLLTKDFFESRIKPIREEGLSRPMRFFEKKQNSGKSSDPLNQKLYTELKTLLVDEMLTKVDRMTMAFGLEARVPFLDHHLVELAFQIQGSLKYKNNQGKYIFKKIMEPYLPKDVLYRPKWGFNVPLKLWFNKELNGFLRDHLSSGALKKNGIFNPKTVQSLLEDHEKDKIDNSNKLFELLVWELWHNQFMAV